MKKMALVISCILMIMILSACENKTLDEARVSVDTYNDTAESYNELIDDYNASVALFKKTNDALDEVIDEAQRIINEGAEPYDKETLLAYKAALADAQKQKQTVPSEMDHYSMMSVDEKASKKTLEALITQADSEKSKILAASAPEKLEIPDYSLVIDQIHAAYIVYEDSVQSQKQVTNPSTDFVIDRLQTIPTILEIDFVTENHDPNGYLNKQGGYTGCIYFSDSQVDRNEIYIEPGFDTVIDVGTIGGGCIEIFGNKEDAERRNSYLGEHDGTIYSSGSHYVFGTVLVRTSCLLTGTQQKDLTNQIEQALIEIRK